MADSLSKRQSLEEKKLELEIEELELKNKTTKQENKDLKTLEKYLPFLTMLIAVGGLCFSVYQYASSQALDRDRDQRKQIQTEIGRLLAASRKDAPSASQVQASLNNLYSLTLHDVDKAQDITDVFEEIFCSDFDNIEKLTYGRVRFENLVNDYWPGYRTAFAENPKANIRLIDRYLEKIKTEMPDTVPYYALQGALWRHGWRLKDSKLNADQAKKFKVDEEWTRSMRI